MEAGAARPARCTFTPGKGCAGPPQWLLSPGLSSDPSEAKARKDRLAGNAARKRRCHPVPKAAAPTPGSQRRDCRLELLPAREGAPADNEIMLHCLFRFRR